LGRIIVERFSPNVRLTATTSVPLRQVSATALDDAGAVMLLGRAKNQPVVVMISEKGEVTQVRAPRNARAVALGVAGTSEVLSVVDHVKRQEASLVTVRAWESGRWKTTERFGVPVPYGSSK
jgi:hypothetical protein